MQARTRSVIQISRASAFRSVRCFALILFWRRDMSRISMIVRKFVKNDEAATMVEYALMLALIAVVCIAAVVIIGTQANTVFTNIGTNLTAAA
jgi:pilus assembly protein Flp/PilA